MAANGVESVVTAETSTPDMNSVEEKSISSKSRQKFLMSAALVVDAKDGLLFLSESTDRINVKLYLLYRHSIFQYMFYLVILLHHLLVLFENNNWINNSLETICLIIYSTRLTHLSLFTPSQVFWSDTKNITVLVTSLMTFCDILINIFVVDYVRWTPVLRPLFVVNLAENKQIRRSFRNIRNTLPDVLNVLTLFFLSVLTFSIIGLKLFEKQSITISNGSKEEKYFSNFFDIFFSLYVLVTTANNPDIMMPAYNKSRWFAIYFVIFLVINLYLFMNIILAVIYNNYRKHLKTEVRNILNLKQKNILRAFSLLTENSDNSTQPKDISNSGITKEAFNEVMPIILDSIGSEAKHRSTLTSIYWSLLESNEIISKESFAHILDLLNFEIKILSKTGSETIFEKYMKGLYLSKLSIMFRIWVKSKYFRNFFDLLILLNAIIIAFNYDYTYIEWILLVLFTIEILAKLYTFGFQLFIHKLWNIFDLLVIGMALILFLIIEFKNDMNQDLEELLDLLLILRVLRLCKIITTINRFKIVVKTVIALIPSISTYIGLLSVVYYSYAIIGMRLFSHSRDDRNGNCQTSPYNQTISANYCTINFNTFPNAMLFLFDLMVVNQWHVLARTEELVLQTRLTRIYFMSFHLICVILVLNIFTAFVLEAFILEYIDLTDNNSKKTNFQLRLEQLGVNCLQKREEPVINAEYTHFEDLVDADHDLIEANSNQTEQELNNFWLSFNLSDLRIIIKEKKSVELLLIKMFQNEIFNDSEHSKHPNFSITTSA